ncbi:MAG: hypothetical protein R3F43_27865 [bacterium]
MASGAGGTVWFLRKDARPADAGAGDRGDRGRSRRRAGPLTPRPRPDAAPPPPVDAGA